MPKKVVKKKAKKKAKKEKEDKDEEENKQLYEIPEFQDPLLCTPRAKLVIQLCNPITRELDFTVEVMITTRVEEIRQMIIDRHDGAVQDISICLGSFDKS